MIKILTLHKCFLTLIGVFFVLTSLADGMLPEDLPQSDMVDDSVINLDIDNQQIYTDPFKRGSQGLQPMPPLVKSQPVTPEELMI